MPYDPKSIANYFLEAAKQDRESLTPLKLIKLVYIAHGWYLATTGEPLINEHPEAWEYGPVIPSLYHEFKIFGNNPIKKKATDFVPQSEEQWMLEEREVEPPNRKKDPEVCNFLDRIWKRYRKLTASQLSTLTHQSGTPWEQTWNERGKYQKGVDIAEDKIREHYQSLKKKSAERPTRTARI